MPNTIALLIDHWKADPHSTYNTWFLWAERLKNFRSIRRGIGQVVRDIDAGTFGTFTAAQLCRLWWDQSPSNVRFSKALTMPFCGNQNSAYPIFMKMPQISVLLPGCSMLATAAIPRKQ